MTQTVHHDPAPADAGGDEATTRERLVAAAVRVFLDEGYEGARVHDIARAAGLTTGAIYGNFRGKADLLLEAIGVRAATELDALLRGTTAVPLPTLLEALGRRLVRPEGPEGRALLLDAVVAGRRDPDVGELVRDGIVERERRFAGLVDRAIDEAVIDPALDRDALVRFCITLALGALVVRTVDLPDRPDDEAWTALVRRLLDAIAPAPAPSDPGRAAAAAPATDRPAPDGEPTAPPIASRPTTDRATDRATDPFTEDHR